ncbi:SH3 domain-containing protein C23A1.17-like [Benincasa hispida]|uniref:SH3 domain-containing protein C23A1.17-like n=1 Tax=Benincasa hispida TaxID=102211 RepID=UPI001900FDBA|nr:SH3 domain-containing protein C23A1.17-like [Benincasa hispida]
MDPFSSSKIFQEFDPRFDWVHQPDSHVLIVHLLGFRSNQLKVQVTSTGKLRVSGERRLGSGKWLRFQKEIDIPADADADKISAKLEEGILYVKQPKKPSAVSSINLPDQQQPKPTAESKRPPAVTKPKPEPPKPAAAKPTVDSPTVRPNAPKSQNEKAEPRKPAAAKPTVDPPTVRPNAPKTQNERPQSQASGKQIPTPPKPQEAIAAPARTPKPAETPSMGSGQPVQDLALKNRTEKETEEKAKAHTTLQDALEKTREEEGKEEVGSKMGEGKEGGGSKMGEEKEGGVAEERRRRRRKRRSEEMVEESGRFRRRQGYKQIIDEVVKELRTNMVTLVLGVAVFVIVYLNLTKKGHVEEEL